MANSSVIWWFLHLQSHIFAHQILIFLDVTWPLPLRRPISQLLLEVWESWVYIQNTNPIKKHHMDSFCYASLLQNLMTFRGHGLSTWGSFQTLLEWHTSQVDSPVNGWGQSGIVLLKRHPVCLFCFFMYCFFLLTVSFLRTCTFLARSCFPLITINGQWHDTHHNAWSWKESSITEWWSIKALVHHLRALCT